MAADDTKHVFISYVHEDATRIKSLCAFLESAQIPYWRDRTSLAPGDAWKSKIREAIRDGSLVFLACFSDNSRGRDRSYMNEELTLAVDEHRQLPRGRTWLIPVRFDDGKVPDLNLGAGETLRDLNHVDLFGEAYTPQAASLITTIHRVMGDPFPNTVTALNAVAQVADADRSEMLKRLTKEMLFDPSRRIELDDLISSEVRRITTALAEPVENPSAGNTESGDDRVVAAVNVAQRYWQFAQPFCQSLQVGARWGSVESLDPWVSGLRSLIAAATRLRAGPTHLLDLRHIPAVAALTTVGLACTGANKWANLRTLVIDPTIRAEYPPQLIPLLEATNPHRPFRNAEWVANVVARVAVAGGDVAAALAFVRERGGHAYFTPLQIWLHTVVRPIFADQIPEDDIYDNEYDRAEVVLGLLSQDCTSEQYKGEPGSEWRKSSSWFGRSTWRIRETSINHVTDFERDFRSRGDDWPLLRGGLFGSNATRAREALDAYAKIFNEISSRRM